MITAKQIRAARALLGWSQQDLADQAVVSINSVRRLEADHAVDPRVSTLEAIQKAFVKAGIEFISDSRGEGVLLRGSDRQSSRVAPRDRAKRRS